MILLRAQHMNYQNLILGICLVIATVVWFVLLIGENPAVRSFRQKGGQVKLRTLSLFTIYCARHP